MIRVGICGATGYTGAEIAKLISGHPDAELSAATSRTYSGRAMDDIFPGMRNLVTIQCEKLDITQLSKRIDCVFLALPHKTSMEYAPRFIEKNIKVIDLSADFRFSDVTAYEAAYQAHSAKDLLKKSVYGLSEIYKNDIQNADIIGNPGCYPTSVLLPLLPLIKEKLVKKDGIIIDSKSGVSGAGRSVSLGTHFCETNEAFKAYKINAHRHIPEMEEVLGIHAGAETKITFVPHLLPATRGMLSTIYVTACENTTEEKLRKTLMHYYGKKTFIRILPSGRFPDIAHVRGTNFCDIGFLLEMKSRRLIIVSVIDNLVKGAAGQAVQNMNIMFGLDEETGLRMIPGPV